MEYTRIDNMRRSALIKVATDEIKRSMDAVKNKKDIARRVAISNRAVTIMKNSFK